MSTLWRETIERGIYAVETEEKRGNSTRRRIRVRVKRNGVSSSTTVSSREEAIRVGRELARELEKRETMSECLVAYREHQIRQGNRSVKTTMTRLEKLVDGVGMVADLTARKCQKLYEAYADTHATTTSLNVMGQARTWGRWMVKREYWKHNRWEEVETYGRRKRGKEQLTRGEANQLMRACLDEGMAAGGVVLSALLLGLRASEIAAIQPRDIDGGILWSGVPRPKTHPEELRCPECSKTYCRP